MSCRYLFGAGLARRVLITDQVCAQVDCLRYHDQDRNGLELELSGPSMSIGYKF